MVSPKSVQGKRGEGLERVNDYGKEYEGRVAVLTLTSRADDNVQQVPRDFRESIINSIIKRLVFKIWEFIRRLRQAVTRVTRRGLRDEGVSIGKHSIKLGII
jgi:hypothetical protein